MALRDWLNPDFDPLATENPAICAENKQKIATIARIAPEIASPAILQVIDSSDVCANTSKNSKNSSSNAPELKNAGLKRLEAAAAGLPIGMDELAVIFADDLEDFGAGAVSMAGISKACEFYARGRPQPQRDEVPAGMVRYRLPAGSVQTQTGYTLVETVGTINGGADGGRKSQKRPQ